MQQHDSDVPDLNHHEHLSRRAVLTALGGTAAGVVAGFAAGGSAVAATEQTQKESVAAKAVIDRTEYSFTPVIIVPNDFVVTDAVIQYVKSIITSGNDKLFRSSGGRLRLAPIPQIVYSHYKEAELAAEPDALASSLRQTLVDSFDDLKNNRQLHKYIGFYVGSAGNADHKAVDHQGSQWLGMAFIKANGPGNAAIVLTDPKVKRGSEDRVFIHEAFHLLGYNHVNQYLVIGDVMNPSLADGNIDIFIDDGYRLDNTSHFNTPALIKQPYLIGPSYVETSIHSLYRTLDKGRLGSPLTGVRARTDRGGYFQQFERGLVAYLDGYGANAVMDLYGQWNLLEHGFPVGGTYILDSQIVQSFEWGQISMANSANLTPDLSMGRSLA